jgi:hypothetical protein
MPLTLADVRVWYPWGTPFVELTDGSDAYPPATRVDTSNAELNAGLRKVTLAFETLAGGVRHDDLMLTGVHLLDDTATPWSTAARFEAAEAAIDAFWNAVKVQFPAATRLAELAWHRSGPAYDAPNSPGASVRRVLRSVVGTAGGTGTKELPRQVAWSLTERTMLRKRWGRMYLPAPASSVVVDGRVQLGSCQLMADAFRDFYAALLAADLVPVVYSPAQPARSKKKGGSLPAKPAAALKVNTVQVDDILDVIRSRRLKRPLVRERRGLAVV